MHQVCATRAREEIHPLHVLSNSLWKKKKNTSTQQPRGEPRPAQSKGGHKSEIPEDVGVLAQTPCMDAGALGGKDSDRKHPGPSLEAS